MREAVALTAEPTRLGHGPVLASLILSAALAHAGREAEAREIVSRSLSGPGAMSELDRIRGGDLRAFMSAGLRLAGADL